MSEPDLLGPADDYPHHVTDEPWETETWWFSFSVPERRMLGYVYVFVRPNLGTCGGGAMVWDDTGYLPWTVPYFSHQWSVPWTTPATPELGGTAALQFPVGVGVTVTEPLGRYRVTYEAPALQLDLDFEAIVAPNVFRSGRYPFTAARHLDQPGRVRGRVALDGEQLAVDCLAMRDRSWGGPRSDLRSTRVSYAFAGIDATNAFLAFAHPVSGAADEPVEENVNAGYLLRDGTKAALISGVRRTWREPVEGWPIAIEIEARDELGRHLATRGDCVNRIVFTPYPRMLNWSSLTRWDMAGATGWGEDQDVWPLEAWRGFAVARRAGTTEAEGRR